VARRPRGGSHSDSGARQTQSAHVEVAAPRVTVSRPKAGDPPARRDPPAAAGLARPARHELRLDPRAPTSPTRRRPAASPGESDPATEPALTIVCSASLPVPISRAWPGMGHSDRAGVVGEMLHLGGGQAHNVRMRLILVLVALIAASPSAAATIFDEATLG